LLAIALAVLPACGAHQVLLRPEPRGQTVEPASMAPNRPAFASVMVVPPAGAGADPTLSDLEAGLIAAGVRVIATKGDADAILQLERMEWVTDHQFFILDADKFVPVGEQAYRAASPRSRWVVESLVFRLWGKLVNAKTGEIVDVLRIEPSSLPDEPISFAVKRDSISAEQYGTGVSTYALPQHRQWLMARVVKALVHHITLRN
jgi:hypothetical protein